MLDHLAICHDCRPWRFQVLTRLAPCAVVATLALWALGVIHL